MHSSCAHMRRLPSATAGGAAFSPIRNGSTLNTRSILTSSGHMASCHRPPEQSVLGMSRRPSRRSTTISSQRLLDQTMVRIEVLPASHGHILTWHSHSRRHAIDLPNQSNPQLRFQPRGQHFLRPHGLRPEAILKAFLA